MSDEVQEAPEQESQAEAAEETIETDAMGGEPMAEAAGEASSEEKSCEDDDTTEEDSEES